MDQRNEEALAGQLGRFYNHLARCIFVEMAHMSPADFAEVRSLVDTIALRTISTAPMTSIGSFATSPSPA
jgi:hypothetical protein